MTTTISTDIHVNDTTEIGGNIYGTHEGYRATVNLDNATLYLEPDNLDRLLGTLLALRATINQEPDLSAGQRLGLSEDAYQVETRHLSHHEQIVAASADVMVGLPWLAQVLGTEGPVLVSKVVTR